MFYSHNLSWPSLQLDKPSTRKNVYLCLSVYQITLSQQAYFWQNKDKYFLYDKYHSTSTLRYPAMTAPVWKYYLRDPANNDKAVCQVGLLILLMSLFFYLLFHGFARFNWNTYSFIMFSSIVFYKEKKEKYINIYIYIYFFFFNIYKKTSMLDIYTACIAKHLEQESWYVYK